MHVEDERKLLNSVPKWIYTIYTTHSAWGLLLVHILTSYSVLFFLTIQMSMQWQHIVVLINRRILRGSFYIITTNLKSVLSTTFRKINMMGKSNVLIFLPAEALSWALLVLSKKREQSSFPLGKPRVSTILRTVSSCGAGPKQFPL